MAWFTSTWSAKRGLPPEKWPSLKWAFSLWRMPGMPQRKHKPEEIVAKLRQVDVLLSQGRPVAEAIRAISVTPFTYYRWRREFGGLKSDQVKRLKDLEKENERLRKAVSDLTLEKLILGEAPSEPFGAPSLRAKGFGLPLPPLPFPGGWR